MNELWTVLLLLAGCYYLICTVYLGSILLHRYAMLLAKAWPHFVAGLRAFAKGMKL